MSSIDVLFTPVQVGELTLPNRIVLAPLTRSRAGQPGNVPTPLMAEYYTQRAGAGLIISEATNISQIAMGYALTPGIFTPEQIDGWRRVTESVHAAGGRMFLQLWHCGRMSHESLHPGEAPVAPSAIPCEQCQVFVVGADGRGGPTPVSPPRELTVDAIRATVQDYAGATRNALAAGFDGVEIHAANGYLIHQLATPQRSAALPSWSAVRPEPPFSPARSSPRTAVQRRSAKAKLKNHSRRAEASRL